MAAEPHIRVVTRKISPTGVPGSMAELDAMKGMCEKFPGDEWVLFAADFVGVEPGPTIDIMFVFVKAEFAPPARAEYYLDQIAKKLDLLTGVIDLEAELIVEDGDEAEDAEDDG